MSDYSKRLPSLNKSRTLFCFSDYSGEEEQANYYSYSFLIVGEENINTWDYQRTNIRKSLLPDGRRISFKNYRDKMSQKFIKAYLNLADELPGYLVTITIDKQVKTIFEKADIFSNPELKECLSWTEDTTEKTFRIIHLLSLLIASFSSIGQNIIWITDNDKIVANKERLIQITHLFSLVASSYLNHNSGHLRVGTNALDDETRLIEDLCAIPDLAAGAYSDQLKKSKSILPDNTPPVFWISAPFFQDKTNTISWWLTTAQKNLCKLCFRMNYSNESATSVEFYQFFSPEDEN